MTPQYLSLGAMGLGSGQFEISVVVFRPHNQGPIGEGRHKQTTKTYKMHSVCKENVRLGGGFETQLHT